VLQRSSPSARPFEPVDNQPLHAPKTGKTAHGWPPNTGTYRMGPYAS